MICRTGIEMGTGLARISPSQSEISVIPTPSSSIASAKYGIGRNRPSCSTPKIIRFAYGSKRYAAAITASGKYTADGNTRPSASNRQFWGSGPSHVRICVFVSSQQPFATVDACSQYANRFIIILLYTGGLYLDPSQQLSSPSHSSSHRLFLSCFMLNND